MLTFEKLRDLERGERESRTLQKLPPDLAEQIAEYMKKKREIKEKSSSDMTEIKSISNVVRGFFEIRERKLLDQLVYSLRTGSRPQNMTSDEAALFDSVYKLMSQNRQAFFSAVDAAGKSEEQKHASLPVAGELSGKTSQKETSSSGDNSSGGKNEKSPSEVSPGRVVAKGDLSSRHSVDDNSSPPKYSAISDIPDFVGPDMKTYSLKAGEAVSLPQELADFLLKKGLVRKAE